MMLSLEDEVITTIAEDRDIDKSEIGWDTNLYDLGVDSLTALEILVVSEGKYDIAIEQEKLRDVKTARHIISVFSDELEKKAAGPTGRLTRHSLGAIVRSYFQGELSGNTLS